MVSYLNLKIKINCNAMIELITKLNLECLPLLILQLRGTRIQQQHGEVSCRPLDALQTHKARLPPDIEEAFSKPFVINFRYERQVRSSGYSDLNSPYSLFPNIF